jgi:hypothetical protein
MDFKLKRGAKENTHRHPAHVVYVLTGFKIRFTFPDGKTAIRETEAHLSPSPALTPAATAI